jgi:hypothetical protein
LGGSSPRPPSIVAGRVAAGSEPRGPSRVTYCGESAVGELGIVMNDGDVAETSRGARQNSVEEVARAMTAHPAE